MHLKMTAENLRDGVPMDSFRCPIALMMLDAGMTGPEVDHDSIYWSPPKALFSCRMTPTAEIQDWMLQFDDTTDQDDRMKLPLLEFDLEEDDPAG